MNEKSGHKIEGIEVTLDNIGEYVTYMPNHAHGDFKHKDVMRGKIKNWSSIGLFVEYPHNTCLTRPEDLRWF